MKTMNDLFKQEKERWLEGARAVARELLMKNNSVTIVDVLNKYPRPQWVHQNTTGQVFKHPDFRACGTEKSNSPKAKGRIICRWTLADDLKHVIRMREYETSLMEFAED